MKRITGECKGFIVQCLACFMSPSETVEAVKTEFGVELTRQQVDFYNPTKGAGAERLSQALRDLFTVTRRDFIASVHRIGLAHLVYRLQLLQRICEESQLKGNDRLILKVLEQAAKEVGGYYISDPEALRAHREAEARLLPKPSARGVVDLETWKAIQEGMGDERAA